MKYYKKSVEDIDVSGKRVLVRCDFNVPQDEEGNITDDKRIRESLRTIEYLVSKNAKVILCSHLGRPKGQFNLKYTLAPVAKRLSELLSKDVNLSADIAGESAKTLSSSMKPGDVILLENVRFDKREEENDAGFSKELSSLADIFVNDAFGTAHRAHSSTAGVAAFLPAVCGYLIKKELDVIGDALENPKRPFVSILGGAKVSDKIGVISNLLDKCDTVIVGGAMAFTFIKAQGGSVGKSRVEDDKLELAKGLLDKAEKAGVKFMLPSDTVAAGEFSPTAEHFTVDSKNIDDGLMGLDIGEKTAESYSREIIKAKTVVWNGPMGVFEFDAFSKGTVKVADAIAKSGAVSIIGGGDSAAAIEKFGYTDRVTHISTGGGASLKLLEGADLPGISCLLDK